MSGRSGLKGALLALALLLLGWGFVRMAQRDLELRLPQAGTSSDGKDEIVLTVESVDLEREMAGRRWHLTAEKLERSQAWVRGYSVEIVLLDESGRRWTFSAPQADYADDLAQVHLTRPSGTLKGDDVDLLWSAGSALWRESDSLWSLSGDLKVADSLSGARLKARYGSFDADGVIVLREEARLSWPSP